MLNRVVAEVGSTAAITEVNKIRSGGVGGFFCREEFEVIIDKSSVKRGRGQGRKAKGKGTSDLLDHEPREALDGSDARFRALLERRLDETSLTEADLAKQPLDRYLSSDDLDDDSPGLLDLDDPEPSGDRPFVIQPPRPASFGPDEFSIGSDAIDEAGARMSESSDQQTPPYVVEYGTRKPADESGFVPRPPEPAGYEPDEPTLILDPAPSGGGTANGPSGPAAGAASDSASRLGGARQPSSFWLRLRRTKRELDASLPPDTDVRAVVGPLALTTPVVRLLQCQHRLDPSDVIVLTSRAEIVSEPGWQLVRSSHQMVEAAQDRDRRPTLLVIDVPVELPVWVAPLLDRLRRAGLGLVRYAVPGTPAERHLLGYRDQANLPYVIDLVSRIRPAELARMFDEGHPIATIAGSELNAELLMALREQVTLG